MAIVHIIAQVRGEYKQITGEDQLGTNLLLGNGRCTASLLNRMCEVCDKARLIVRDDVVFNV
jgi:hypothetical protein